MKTSTASVLNPLRNPSLSCPQLVGLQREHSGAQSNVSALIDAKVAADTDIARLTARVQQLSAQLADANERARRAVAQDLHDDFGASLTAARLALARIETWLPADAPAQCAEALGVTKHALDAVCDASHRVIANLHQPDLEDGFGPSLDRWIARFAAATSLDVDFTCPANLHVPADTALAMFRIVQEALNNVAKHAKATHADVHVEASARAITLIVHDDGVGMTAGSRRKAGRFGLSGMRARCDALGGMLRISSAPGRTAVRAVFPVAGVRPRVVVALSTLSAVAALDS